MVEIFLKLLAGQVVVDDLAAVNWVLAIVAFAVASALALRLHSRKASLWIVLIVAVVGILSFQFIFAEPFRRSQIAEFEEGRVNLIYPRGNCAESAEFRIGGRQQHQFGVDDFRRLQDRGECRGAVRVNQGIFLTLSFIFSFLASLSIWLAVLASRSRPEWSEIETTIISGLRWIKRGIAATREAGKHKPPDPTPPAAASDVPKAPPNSSAAKDGT